MIDPLSISPKNLSLFHIANYDGGHSMFGIEIIQSNY
jgi:hypothetical protein